VGGHVERTLDVTATEHLNQVLFARESSSDEHVGVDLGDPSATRASRLTGVYSTRKGLVNPFNFGMRWRSGN